MLEVMLPFLAPVPAPVVVNAPSVVSAPLVAAVVNAPAVVQAPAGVQQLVGQVQDLVIQNVAIVQPQITMEVEDDNEILKRLFLQRFGRALPELERSPVDDINQAMDLIDLTKEDDDEMEVAAPAAVVVVVKTESIETPEAAPIDDRRRSSRLRKNVVIQEKEAPLAAENNVIADNDTDMAEDVSVNPVGPVNTVEPLTADEAFEMAEQAIAESDAAIAENQRVIDKFYNTE